jgi:3-hydroxyanthranilate 3,4-dioxygenase
VKGPNIRDDFHLQPGQELFFMLKGDMNLDVMEEGKGRRRIPIAEDHMFLLPEMVHHSPQRYPDTIGLVFERIRKSTDVDYLKWFKPASSEVLYQENFHCADINNALKPIIGRFLASECAVELKAAPKAEPPVSEQFSPSVMRVSDAVAEAVAGKSSTAALKAHKAIAGEFVVEFYCGAGSAALSLGSTDTFILQKSGKSVVSISGGASITLCAGEASFLPIAAGATATIEQSNAADGAAGVIMVVTCTMP